MASKLSEIIIPNTGIRNWIGLYGTEKLADYGLEYLTAIKYGLITKHPSGLDMNPNVPDSDLEDRIADNVNSNNSELSRQERETRINERVHHLIKGWNNGVIPPSIKTLLALTDNGIDILNPESYDGTKANTDGIPLSLKRLDEIASLTAMAISAGNIANGYYVTINFPFDSALRNEMRDWFKMSFPDQSENQKEIALPTHYGRFLSLLGMNRGALRDGDFSDIGVGYISQLVSYIKSYKIKDRNDADYEHARNVLKGFVDGFIMHRFRHASPKKGSMLDLPVFTNEDTSDKLSDLFADALKIVYPIVDFRAWTEQHTNRDKRYYRGKMIFR